MGYTTTFTGRFEIAPVLTVADMNRLNAIVDDAPNDSPGGYCQWVPTDDGAGLAWDENEKFYDYVEWLAYLVEKVLAPAGYKVNGRVSWGGEDRSDVGTLVVSDNVVTALNGHIDGQVPTVFVALRDLVEAAKGSRLSFDDCSRNDDLYTAVMTAERVLKEKA